MYKIITPTGEQFLTEKVNYIRVHKSGVYLLTDVNHAEGVAHHGTPYLFKDGAPMPPLTIIRAKRHRGANAARAGAAFRKRAERAALAYGNIPKAGEKPQERRTLAAP